MKSKVPTINIHGKEYVQVATRVQMAHEDKENKTLSIQTELVPADNILFKATVTTNKGTFTGYSAANPAKQIEKSNPYEVAETSAVGRALGFAGYGSVDHIASADEMIKANISQDTDETKSTNNYTVTAKQTAYIRSLLHKKGHTEKELMFKYEVNALSSLTGDQASTIIENLTKLPDASAKEEEELDLDAIDLDLKGGGK